jgi:hypothetical protein
MKSMLLMYNFLQQSNNLLRVLTAASLKIRAFWDVGPCSILVNRHFRGAYCLHHQGGEFIALMIEAVRTYKTSVYYNETTRRNIPEGSNLQI